MSVPVLPSVVRPPLPGMIDLKQLSYGGTSSIMVYGPTGIGKTTLVMNFKPKGRRFVFDIEAGLKSVGHFPDTDIYPVTSYQQLFQGIGWIEQDTEHDVVIVDNLTEMARLVMQGALSAPPIGGSRPFAEIPILSDWSLTIERMRTLVRRIRLLIRRGKWVFFTCASSMEKDQITGRIVGRPELPGKQLPEEVPYLMDEVYRMDAEQTAQGPQRVIYTQPDTIWTAKSRVQNAPAKVVVARDDVNALNFLRPKE